MAGVRHEVLDRDPPHAGALAAVADFVLGPASPASPALGLEPGWSLYSLELADPRAAVFVRLDDPLDLTGPFIMNQQRAHAREVLVVPIDEFTELAAEVPQPSQLAFLFSTGRCGSTLASRVMAQLPGVVSLSEPDVYSNLVMARSVLADEEAVGLLRAATAVLCHGVDARDADQIVIKPRSEPVLQEAAYAAAYPEARHAFMYRDVLGYTRSIIRYVRRIIGALPRGPMDQHLDGWNQVTAGEPLSTLGRVIDLERADIGAHEFVPTAWALRIEAHLAARDRGDGGGRMEAIHYDDLIADRERETARLLAACGLDHGLTDEVRSVFERDAHHGMVGANDTPVRDLDATEVAEVLRQLPDLDVPPYDVQRL